MSALTGDGGARYPARRLWSGPRGSRQVLQQAVERRLGNEKPPTETDGRQPPALRESVGGVAAEPKNLTCFFDSEGSPRNFFGAHGASLLHLILDILCNTNKYISLACLNQANDHAQSSLRSYNMPRTRRTTSDAAPDAGTRSGGDENAAKRSDKETVVTLRLPRDLHDRLRKAGGERGLTAQIRDRLDASLTIEEAWNDPLFADFMRAVGYVIVSAWRLYPSDPDAYPMIDVAVRMLLDAFRPKGARNIIHEIYIPATVQMMAKIERLLGFAFGALGEDGIALAAKLPFSISVASEDEEKRA